MIPNPYPGIFIVIDGIDGCGKSTQVKLLAEWLRRDVYPNIINPLGLWRVVLETKEPDKTGLFGKMIYADLAKNNGLHVTDPARFQMWYACDSKIHLRDKIIPRLELDGIVISDRFRSSMVYGARSVSDIHALMATNRMIIGEHFIWPDAIFIIDVPVELAMERLKEKGRKLDGHEQVSVLKHTKERYQQFAELYSNCILIEDEGDSSREAKFDAIKVYVEDLLKQKPACGV